MFGQRPLLSEVREKVDVAIAANFGKRAPASPRRWGQVSPR
jgi:hypothetical protein